jgi:putative redox protein
MTDDIEQTLPADDPAPSPPAAGKPPARVRLAWTGEGMQFDGGKLAGGPTIRIDNGGKTGPGPVDTLLLALAACTTEDVLTILDKRRTPADALRVEVTGTRRSGVPARLTHVHLRYVVDGDGIDRANTLRAIELAVTKYCSVRDSLDPAIPIEWSLTLNGEDEPEG